MDKKETKCAVLFLCFSVARFASHSFLSKHFNMRVSIAFGFAAAASLALAGPCHVYSSNSEASVTPSATPIETPLETPSLTPSLTPSETLSETPSQTPAETPAETPVETPTPEMEPVLLPTFALVATDTVNTALNNKVLQYNGNGGVRFEPTVGTWTIPSFYLEADTHYLKSDDLYLCLSTLSYAVLLLSTEDIEVLGSVVLIECSSPSPVYEGDVFSCTADNLALEQFYTDPDLVTDMPLYMRYSDQHLGSVTVNLKATALLAAP
ncbi:hypothetical protein B0J13DRAFT_557474 [Dactylonectria estremocensis]|uniref:Uncharacterized protein n=1 Tax=Dactylonectria estremocensis TaxID=1079267 RepID=A0A9P9EMQ0_9HYPO|nr:hypothetical protein B0J13DRAFT_557474 [Dactylonectria estremocensis]